VSTRIRALRVLTALHGLPPKSGTNTPVCSKSAVRSVFRVSSPRREALSNPERQSSNPTDALQRFDEPPVSGFDDVTECVVDRQHRGVGVVHIGFESADAGCGEFPCRPELERTSQTSSTPGLVHSGVVDIRGRRVLCRGARLRGRRVRRAVGRQSPRAHSSSRSTSRPNKEAGRPSATTMTEARSPGGDQGARQADA
jgi:hypothetical protein